MSLLPTVMRRSRWMAVVSICAFAAASTACSVHAAGPTVEFKGQRFDVEIADTQEARARGLMFRDSMPADHGMFFIFESPFVQTFWMKNTRIPLDILYFDSNYKLVSVQERVPPCRSDPCSQYPSAGPAQYVLELNSGMTAKLGAKPGDVLTFKR